MVESTWISPRASECCCSTLTRLANNYGPHTEAEPIRAGRSTSHLTLGGRKWLHLSRDPPETTGIWVQATYLGYLAYPWVSLLMVGCLPGIYLLRKVR